MDVDLNDNVLHMDCMELLKNIPNKIFSHVITDIPYDVVSRESAGIRVFDKKEADQLYFSIPDFVEEIVRTTQHNILIFCASEQVSILYNNLKKHGYHIGLGIWEKTNPSPVNGQHFWLSGVECCVVASKNMINDEDLIWRFPIGRSKEHPTEKPVKLIEYLIEKFTHTNDLIFDPCAGSGSHLLAAKNKNRRYFGTEAYETYYQIIKNKGL